MSDRHAGFFDESPGERSMTRLLSFLISATAIIAVLFPLFTGGEVQEWLVAQLLGYAIGAKHLGRYLESRQ